MKQKKFRVTFLAGNKRVSVLETRTDCPMTFANLTIGELCDTIPTTEQFLEKLLGYRVHIEMVDEGDTLDAIPDQQG